MELKSSKAIFARKNTMLQLKMPLILASNSPRRKEIMTKAGFEFTVKVKETEEDFSSEMIVEKVPEYLATKKAKAFESELDDALIICADTVVIVDGQILNKPADYAEASQMLQLLCGKTHKVVTGVCFYSKNIFETLSDTAFVTVKKMTDWEIDYYIKTCKPFDKAGAYGVQDFMGMACISKIEGSYYTVMGLPIHRVYEKLDEMGFILRN